jgi:predicted acetyltransferase
MPASTLEVVNPIALGEVPGWVRTIASTFLNDPADERTDDEITRVERVWDPERAWGARDRGRWVATLATEPRTLTVPGRNGATGLLMADAVSAVTVAATHRRRGLLRRMLDDSLRAARERGDAISILTAAEYPIYGRFGYAPVTVDCTYTLYPRRPGGQVAGEPGRVRHVDHDEFVALAPDIYERSRRRRAGQVDRDHPWWPWMFGGGDWPEPPKRLLHNYIVHEGDDGLDGLLGWRTVRDAPTLPPLGAVEVLGPHAATDAAERDLWAYLTGLDLIEEVRLEHRPPDEPVRWLLPDARTLVLTELVDHVWGKLLDVPAALAARAYSAPGQLVLELTDETTAGVAGRYRLTVADDGAGACEPTAAAPDITLPQTVLASAYLGGFPIAQQRIAGAVTEHTPGSLTRADAIFHTALAPWNATGF